MTDPDVTTGFIDDGWVSPPIDLHTLPDVRTEAARQLMADIEADVDRAIGELRTEYVADGTELRWQP